MPLLGLPLNRCAESSSTKFVKSFVIPCKKHFRLLDKNEDRKNSLNKNLRKALAEMPQTYTVSQTDSVALLLQLMRSCRPAEDIGFVAARSVLQHFDTWPIFCGAFP